MQRIRRPPQAARMKAWDEGGTKTNIKIHSVAMDPAGLGKREICDGWCDVCGEASPSMLWSVGSLLSKNDNCQCLPANHQSANAPSLKPKPLTLHPINHQSANVPSLRYHEHVRQYQGINRHQLMLNLVLIDTNYVLRLRYHEQACGSFLIILLLIPLFFMWINQFFIFPTPRVNLLYLHERYSPLPYCAADVLPMRCCVLTWAPQSFALHLLFLQFSKNISPI